MNIERTGHSRYRAVSGDRNALLRQLVEVEYLAFLGYVAPEHLGRWYRASAGELREQFKPARMRKESDGLFRDEEYWLHCDVGGHPHPRARLLLRAYADDLDPGMFVLPDAVQHVRRLWTSLRLLLPKLGGDEVLARSGPNVTSAIKGWETVEEPEVLTHDGIPTKVPGLP